MRDLRDLAHQRDDRARDDADHQRERDQVELVAAHERPQPRQRLVRTASLDDPRESRKHRQSLLSNSDIGKPVGHAGRRDQHTVVVAKADIARAARPLRCLCCR